MANADNSKARKQDEFFEKLDELTETLKGTNFNDTIQTHFEVIMKYKDVARVKKEDAFPDRETYESFIAAKIFFDKIKFLEFQKPEDTPKTVIEDEDDNMPPMEAFHYTPDQIEMKKNIILKNISKGDVLNLLVVEEDNTYYKLQILNKYNNRERIVDVNLIVPLEKGHYYVKEITPPLQVGEFVRAVCIGNLKNEEGKYKQPLINLRQESIGNEAWKHLHLGRISKADIPYYPVDITKYETFGDFLKDNSKEETPKTLRKYATAFGGDPSKTGPMYNTRNKKQIIDVDAREAELKQKLSIMYEKTANAERLLKEWNLMNAMLEIQEALEINPKNDVALTIRGKIYLAFALGKPCRNVKKAFLDFESALRLNRFNPDALSLRDSILMESSERFEAKKMVEKVQAIQDALRGRTLNKSTVEFLNIIKKRKAENEASVATPVVKKERLDF